LDNYLAGSPGSPKWIYVTIQGPDCQVREVVLERWEQPAAPDPPLLLM
jgi:hypothetical protein